MPGLLMMMFHCMYEIWLRLRELSKTFREEIINLHKQGKGHKKTAKALHFPRDTEIQLEALFASLKLKEQWLHYLDVADRELSAAATRVLRRQVVKTLDLLQKTCSKTWWHQALRFQFPQ